MTRRNYIATSIKTCVRMFDNLKRFVMQTGDGLLNH